MGDQDGSRLLSIRSFKPYMFVLELVKSLEHLVVVKWRDISPGLSLNKQSRANDRTVPAFSTFPPTAYCYCIFVQSCLCALLVACLETALPVGCQHQSGYL